MTRKIEVSDPWFTYLLQEVKTVEGRKASPKWVDLTVGQKVWFKDPSTDRSALFELTRITTYDSLEQYLICEGLRQTVPGTTTLQEGIAVYMEWNTPEELAQFKFLGIEVKLVRTAGAMMKVLGALAFDLSLDSRNLEDRYERMKRLSKDLGRDDFLAWLENHYENVAFNSSILKTWPGPYGQCTKEHLNALCLKLSVFTHPHRSLEDDPLTEVTLNVIGALALSIRLEYFDIKTRSELIKDLAQKINRHDLVSWIDENYEKLSENGRIIQGWPGPYRSCTVSDLKELGLTRYIFDGAAIECLGL